MQMVLGRTKWFALLFAVTMPLITLGTPVQAQDRARDPRDWQYSDRDRANSLRGLWTLTRDISGDNDASLSYRLILRDDGRAVMVVERNGWVRRNSSIDNDFGSMLYVYLNRDRRATHTGTWSGDRDGVTISLTEINGRRDNAVFRGRLEGRRLRLTTSNPGMYGRDTRFSFRSEGIGGSPRDRWDRDDDYRNDRDRNDRNDRDRYDRDRYDRGDRGDRGDRNDRNDRYDRDDRNRPGDRRDDGELTWQGSVDAGAILYIRQNNVRTETTNDRSVNGVRSNFSRSLPLRPVRVSLTRIEGRGTVTIMEQPSSRNDYTAVIKINDPEEGRGDYRLTLAWD